MYSKNLEQCLVKIVRSKGLLCKFHTELALKSTCPLAIAAILKIYIFLFISISRIIFLIPLSWQFWPPHVKSWLIGKDSGAGRNWGQEEKGTTEDEIAGWHHRLDGRESEWTPGDGDAQGGLACCDSWGDKELDTTERVNWTELNWTELKLTIKFMKQWFASLLFLLP